MRITTSSNINRGLAVIAGAFLAAKDLVQETTWIERAGTVAVTLALLIAIARIGYIGEEE